MPLNIYNIYNRFVRLKAHDITRKKTISLLPWQLLGQQTSKPPIHQKMEMTHTEYIMYNEAEKGMWLSVYMSTCMCMHLCVSDERCVCRCSVPAVSLIKRHWCRGGCFGAQRSPFISLLSSFSILCLWLPWSTNAQPSKHSRTCDPSVAEKGKREHLSPRLYCDSFYSNV